MLMTLVLYQILKKIYAKSLHIYLYTQISILFDQKAVLFKALYAERGVLSSYF